MRVRTCQRVVLGEWKIGMKLPGEKHGRVEEEDQRRRRQTFVEESRPGSQVGEVSSFQVACSLGPRRAPGKLAWASPKRLKELLLKELTRARRIVCHALAGLDSPHPATCYLAPSNSATVGALQEEPAAACCWILFNSI
eukprot:scaffold104824_cov22-Tisochrysis_lutea.AAC.1